MVLGDWKHTRGKPDQKMLLLQSGKQQRIVDMTTFTRVCQENFRD